MPANEILPRNHGAAHHIARARRVLGEAVHEHVHIELTVLMKAGERVVHHRERTLRTRQLRDRRDVRHLGHGIRGALEEHELRRPRRELALDAVEIFDRQHRARHAEAPEQPADEITAWVVGFDEADDVIARLRQREQRLRYRADARRRDEAIVAPLQFRECELELTRGRDSTSACRRTPERSPRSAFIVSSSESNSNLTVW